MKDEKNLSRSHAARRFGNQINVPPPFAIIIVNWNVVDMLAACLRSVEADLAESQLQGQIWVVDNASTDGSVGMLRRDFPRVQLIASEKNLGFAGGNNAALRAIGFDPSPLPSPERGGEHLPEAVLLLNPDTEVQPGALRALFDFLKSNPQAGIAGARLVYGDGSFQHSAFAFPGLWQLAFDLLPLPDRLVESGLNGRYPRSAYASGRPFRVDHPLGAAMCVRREAIQQVGLLDERYRMYVEEVDWSKRIVAAGWAVYCVPAAQITHFGGQSTGQVRLSSFINLWTSRYQFYRKCYSPLKVRLAAQIVRLGMRRKARLDAGAAQRGELSQSELVQRLSGYEQVINIWQGKTE
jgi:GT2 family glycosyltransferase